MKQQVYRDPVCGKKLNRQKAHILVHHKGRDYLICCPLCQRQFEDHPENYANPQYGYKVPAKVKEKGRQTR